MSQWVIESSFVKTISNDFHSKAWPEILTQYSPPPLCQVSGVRWHTSGVPTAVKIFMRNFYRSWQCKKFMINHDNSWHLVTINDNSCRFMTIQDNSWWFMTTHDDSWQLMTLLDSYLKLLTIPDDSWQPMMICDK